MCLISSSKLLIHQHSTDSGHNVGFTSVDAGNMSLTVLEQHHTAEDTRNNRRALESALGIDPGTTRFVSQTHSAIVQSSGDRGWGQVDTLGEGDAIISEDGRDPIAILVADCLPIAFTTNYGPTAIAHAGRVGLLDGIIQNTVRYLRSLDTQGAGTISATIGPGICGKCYEVPEHMRDQAAQDHPAIFSQTTWGSAALDLPAAAEAILQEQDVEVRHVNECTFTNERLFSHRRAPGIGRLAGVVLPTHKA